MRLDGFLFKSKSILIPDELRSRNFDDMSLHAGFEKTDDIAVVWILSEAQTFTVVHELLELFWLFSAELINGNLLLLLLDVGVLLGLGSTWKSLPWE